MIKQENIYKIGQFVKPHGLKGEISLIVSCDIFDETDVVFLICEIEGIFVPFFVESFRYKTDTVVLVKFENVDTEDVAREFSNREVYCPIDKISGINVFDNASWDNYTGYEVTDKHRGYLGKILDIDQSTLNILFKVIYKEKELLIPVVKEFILSVEHGERSICVSLPDGLFEL